MRARGLAGIRPGPNLRQRHPEQRIAPELGRGGTAAAPPHGWALASPSSRRGAGGRSLVARVDLAAREVGRWARAARRDLPLGRAAVERAVWPARPPLWHSDQGRHGTNPRDTRRREEAGVRSSMAGNGRARDPVGSERRGRSGHDDDVDRHASPSPRAPRRGRGQARRQSNAQRPPSALAHRTPAAVSFGKAQMPSAAGSAAARERAGRRGSCHLTVNGVWCSGVR